MILNEGLVIGMGNRGSKSVVSYYCAIVKEQRVNVYRYLQDPPIGESTLDGWIFVKYLRCILMSLVISYYKILYIKFFYNSPLIGFDSLNLNTRRYYSTLSSNKHNKDDLQIDPWFITGFSDGSNLSLVVWGY